MKDSDPSTGRFVLFLMNLLWEIGWGIVGIALLVLRRWFSLPLWCGLAALLLWVLVALVKTAFLTWSIRMGARRDPPRENKNPYTIRLQFPLPAVGRDVSADGEGEN